MQLMRANPLAPVLRRSGDAPAHPSRAGRRTLLLGLAAVTATGLVACGSSAEPAHTGSIASLENCGVRVDIDQPIQRAVAINQPASELLLTLGLADRMAGMSFADTPVLPELQAEAAKVKKFDTEFTSLESVLGRDPDLVYATFDYTFTGEGIAPRQRFTDLGIPTYQSMSECGGQDAEQDRRLSLDDLYTEIGEVSTLFGIQDRGAELVDDLKTRSTTAADGLNAGDVSLAWWYSGTKTPYIAGCCGAPGIITEAVGARNAFDDNKQLWPEIGWESIIARDPDVLVLGDLSRGEDGDSAQAKIDYLESNPATRNMTAVRNKRYIIIDGTSMDPSIRNVTAIEQVAAGLRDLGVAQ